MADGTAVRCTHDSRNPVPAMTELKVEVTRCPAKADLEFISRGIQTFNQRAVPGFPDVSEDLRFAVFARNDRGDVVGGLRAIGFWGSLTIELLWLLEAVRSVGAGSRLVGAAESFARDHGLKYARVATTSFQARPFYEKLGYRVYGVQRDFPLGHTSYFLSRRL